MPDDVVDFAVVGHVLVERVGGVMLRTVQQQSNDNTLRTFSFQKSWSWALPRVSSVKLCTNSNQGVLNRTGTGKSTLR